LCCANKKDSRACYLFLFLCSEGASKPKFAEAFVNNQVKKAGREWKDDTQCVVPVKLQNVKRSTPLFLTVEGKKAWFTFIKSSNSEEDQSEVAHCLFYDSTAACADSKKKRELKSACLPAVAATASKNVPDVQAMKCPELKLKLKEFGKPTSGLKKDLIVRLQQCYNNGDGREAMEIAKSSSLVADEQEEVLTESGNAMDSDEEPSESEDEVDEADEESSESEIEDEVNNADEETSESEIENEVNDDDNEEPSESEDEVDDANEEPSSKDEVDDANEEPSDNENEMEDTNEEPPDSEDEVDNHAKRNLIDELESSVAVPNKRQRRHLPRNRNIGTKK